MGTCLLQIVQSIYRRHACGGPLILDEEVTANSLQGCERCGCEGRAHRSNTNGQISANDLGRTKAEDVEVCLSVWDSTSSRLHTPHSTLPYMPSTHVEAADD